MVCKVDASMNPMDLINNMFMSFGRILLRELDRCIVKIGVHEHPFIFKNIHSFKLYVELLCV